LKHKCLIIYNPNSGKALHGHVLSQYRKILHKNGYLVDVIKTKYCLHAADVVANANDYDIVFSIGGDGTLNEVVKGNYLREEPLTICPLPSGTCNDVASMLGYGKDPIENLNMALNGDIHQIDIGTINNQPFIYVVGMGQFMHIPYETNREAKKKVGYFAYIKDGLLELFDKFKNYKMEIEVDNFKFEGEYSLVMVSNSNHIAGIDGFHKNVYLDDGEMEVILCKSNNKTEFITDFFSFFLGQDTSNIITLRAHNIKVNLKEKLKKKWCIDGEKYDYDGMQYHITVDRQMNFLVPSEKTKTRKLFIK